VYNTSDVMSVSATAGSLTIAGMAITSGNPLTAGMAKHQGRQKQQQ